jgi:hypothetical protein
MSRQIPQRDADALKAASHTLVDKAGGVAKAAQLTATSHSRLSEAASPWHDNRWLSLIHIADLECAAGEPVITRALAQLSGFVLVPAGRQIPQDFHQHLAHIIIETSDVESLLATALKDGVVSRAEAQRGVQETQQAIDRLQALQADFVRVSGGGASDISKLVAVK